MAVLGVLQIASDVHIGDGILEEGLLVLDTKVGSEISLFVGVAI